MGTKQGLLIFTHLRKMGRLKGGKAEAHRIGQCETLRPIAFARGAQDRADLVELVDLGGA